VVPIRVSKTVEHQPVFNKTERSDSSKLFFFIKKANLGTVSKTIFIQFTGRFFMIKKLGTVAAFESLMPVHMASWIIEPS
jgi:hypothetical protein